MLLHVLIIVCSFLLLIGVALIECITICPSIRGYLDTFQFDLL